MRAKTNFAIAAVVWTTMIFILAAGTRVFAEDISGTISATRTITADSRLVGDVTCLVTNNPCIVFGASGIKLSLNGFTITGPANPDDSSTCNPPGGAPPEDLIRTINQTDVQILGPGMVQRSRRDGINIMGTPGVSTRVTVKQVILHDNCFNGIRANAMSDSIIEGNTLIRNAMNSGAMPFGGINLTNSDNNHVRRNQLSGNGSVCPAPTCTASDVTAASNNDFAIGVIGTSSGNLIETNSISGNTNGILISGNPRTGESPAGNVLRQNIIAANPPSQMSRDYGAIGFDMKDQTNDTRNIIEGNQCLSYSGPEPSACPNFPAVDATAILSAANAPSATGISFAPSATNPGGSVTATFSGSNLGADSYFDVRYRMPGSTTDLVAQNWQRGTSVRHLVGVGTSLGTWTVTGVRAHTGSGDAAGPFTMVSVTLSVIP